METVGSGRARYAMMADSPVPHRLHAADRNWSETNCYTDLWIEVLNYLNLDPIAGLAFLLSVGFNGEQWSLFKYPIADLQAVFGIDLEELHIWRPLVDHVDAHLAAGRILTVEVDGFFLPDLSGTTYRKSHHKTTIAIYSFDRVGSNAGYFHARGAHTVDGPDYLGIFVDSGPAFVLPPYVEVVHLDRLVDRQPSELLPVVRERVRHHLAKRPETNAVDRLRAKVAADLLWLPDAGAATFHAYAFGTFRQFGAWASTLSEFVGWLGERDLSLGSDDQRMVEEARLHFAEIGTLAKKGQYQLARVRAGRTIDLDAVFTDAANRWASAYELLVGVYLS